MTHLDVVEGPGDGRHDDEQADEARERPEHEADDIEQGVDSDVDAHRDEEDLQRVLDVEGGALATSRAWGEAVPD